MADEDFRRGGGAAGAGADLLWRHQQYLPPATKLGQGYIFTGICDSVQGGACVVAWGACMVAGGMCGCRGACMVAGGHVWLPGGRDMVNERAVRILLECILVC